MDSNVNRIIEKWVCERSTETTKGDDQNASDFDEPKTSPYADDLLITLATRLIDSRVLMVWPSR